MYALEKEEMEQAMELVMSACDVAEGILSKSGLTDTEREALNMLIGIALSGVGVIGCAGGGEVLFDEEGGIAIDGNLEDYVRKHQTE